MRFLIAYSLTIWGAAHRYYGNRFSAVSEYRAAVRYYGRALKIDPTLRMPRLHRGILLWRELDRPGEALADFDALLAGDGGDGEALFNRAMAYNALGDYAAALADLEAYLQLPDNEAYRDEAGRTAELLRALSSSSSASRSA